MQNTEAKAVKDLKCRIQKLRLSEILNAPVQRLAVEI